MNTFSTPIPKPGTPPVNTTPTPNTSTPELNQTPPPISSSPAGVRPAYVPLLPNSRGYLYPPAPTPVPKKLVPTTTSNPSPTSVVSFSSSPSKDNVDYLSVLDAAKRRLKNRGTFEEASTQVGNLLKEYLSG